MNIVVANYSGNVGKSTLCQYLLKPRIDAEIFSIETINANDFDDIEILKGEQFKELIAGIDEYENSIIDVGSSNVEDFFAQLKKFKASNQFDCFIIPVTPVSKQQVDTISTIKALLSLNVSKDKIFVVLNMVDDVDLLESHFSTLIEYHSKNNDFVLNFNALIIQNEFYSLNKGSGKTIDDIINDERDFRALIIKARKTESDKIQQLSHERAIQLLASGVKDELDIVFYELFGTAKIEIDDDE